MFDPLKIKQDFPIFSHLTDGKELIYLDNAATTQKPKCVLDSMVDFYSNYNANVARSSHFLANKATEMYEASRKSVAHFLGAEPNEIVFTKNATESLNIVALSWGMSNIQQGDVILTTSAEHNSSLLPWKAIAKEKGAEIKCFYMDRSGHIRGDWESEFDGKVKAVVIAHVSNVLGVINPIKDICRRAHEVGAVVIVDGSQAVSYKDVNVKSLGCDFYAFSGHKMLGPMGIGVLWGKKELLDTMVPISFGGGMVKEASVSTTALKDVPERFEAGTPNVAGAVGLASAVGYISKIGMFNIEDYIEKLVNYAYYKLSNIADLRILGPALKEERSGLISFYIENIHSHDIAAILSNEGIAVRSGLHCSMSLYKDLEIPSTTRASFYIYNTEADIDALVNGVRKAVKILKW